jgi:hypothetical protein
VGREPQLKKVEPLLSSWAATPPRRAYRDHNSPGLLHLQEPVQNTNIQKDTSCFKSAAASPLIQRVKVSWRAPPEAAAAQGEPPR